MKVSGTNILTKNKSGLTKELYIKLFGVSAEIKTTKRGIAVVAFNGKIIKNGDSILLIPHNGEVFDFEEILVEK